MAMLPLASWGLLPPHFKQGPSASPSPWGPKSSSDSQPTRSTRPGQKDKGLNRGERARQAWVQPASGKTGHPGLVGGALRSGPADLMETQQLWVPCEWLHVYICLGWSQVVCHLSLCPFFCTEAVPSCEGDQEGGGPLREMGPHTSPSFPSAVPGGQGPLPAWSAPKGPSGRRSWLGSFSFGFFWSH